MFKSSSIFKAMFLICIAVGMTAQAESAVSTVKAAKPAAAPTPCPSSFRIASGGKGTAYYLIAQELANQMRTLYPGCIFDVLETAGGVENLNKLRNGQADVVLANSSLAWEASVGHPRFANKPIPVRILATLLPNTMHLVASNSSGIIRFADLRGKRVSTGAAGSGTEVVSSFMLQGSGIDWNADIARVSLSLDESLNQIRDGTIDAFIFGAAVPISPIANLLQSGKFHLVSTANTISKLSVHGRIYREGLIPANTYSGQAQAIKTLDVWDTLIVGEHFPWQVAHALTRALFENKEAFVRAHKSMQHLDISAQSQTIVALHLGSQRYFAEAGVKPFARDFGFIKHDSNVVNSDARR